MMSEIYKTSDGREYEPVIGMEVHAELKTASKMYCRCKALFGDPPNTNVCEVCMGLPGSLPVVNEHAVILGTRAALALHCSFDDKRFAQFARKHYYYPDLPKGYQVTMYQWPVASNGYLEMWSDDVEVKVGIERVHLEEDTAKLFHEPDLTSSVDYNRAGIPLLEIVSKPEIGTPSEAKLYLKELRDILRRCGISDGNMEEGSFRCEANISLKKAGSATLGVKSEIKNLNSFTSVEKALRYEIERHLAIYDRGEAVRPDTRGWDESKNETFHMRFKERADEYRYFPEPDLPDLYLSNDIVGKAKTGLAMSPFDEKKQLIAKYGLDHRTANLISGREGGMELYMGAVESGADGRDAANWMTGDFYAFLNEENRGIESTKISGAIFAEFLQLVRDGVVSGPVAKELIREISQTGENPRSIVKSKGLMQVSDDDELLPLIKGIIDANPRIVASFKAGKTRASRAIVGKVMEATGGKANPARVGELVDELLRRE